MMQTNDELLVEARPVLIVGSLPDLFRNLLVTSRVFVALCMQLNRFQGKVMLLRRVEVRSTASPTAWEN